MPEQSLLDVLRRSGGLAAIARQLDISPADAVAAARSLMPLVQFGFRRRVEQADNREAGLQALLALLDQAGGGILVSRVLHEDPLEPEAASALLTAIFGATALGAPISTTQAAASSVVGAGVSSGKGANWKVVGEMMLAWIFTIPFAAVIAFLMFWLTQLPAIMAWVAVGAVVIAFTLWVIWAMRHTVHADDIEAEIPGEEELAEFDQDPTPHLKGTPPVS